MPAPLGDGASSGAAPAAGVAGRFGAFLERRATWVVVLVALWAQWPLLLNAWGVYWDDWCVWDQPHDTMMWTWRGNGLVWAGWLHALLSAVGNGVWLHRLATVVAWCVIPVATMKLARRAGGLPLLAALSVGAFTAAAPLMAARASLSIVHYSVMPALVAAGAALVSRPARMARLPWRIAAALLFFVGCHFPSVPPIAVAAWLAAAAGGLPRENGESLPAALIRRLRRAPEIPIAIVLAMVLGRLVFRPEPDGPWAAGEYGALTIEGLLRAPLLFPVALQKTATAFGAALGNLNPVWVIVAALAAAWGPRAARSRESSPAALSLGVVAALAVMGLGLLPYLALGKLASQEGWQTRHALLVAPGAALLIVALARCLGLRGRAATFAGVLVVACCARAGAATQLEHLRDWLKREATMQALAGSELIREGTVVAFEDEFPTMGERWRVYECSGMLRWVRGDASCYGARGLSAGEAPTIPEYPGLPDAWSFGEFARAADGSAAGASVRVVVRPPERFAPDGDVLKALLARLTSRESFDEMLPRFARVSVERF